MCPVLSSHTLKHAKVILTQFIMQWSLERLLDELEKEREEASQRVLFMAVPLGHMQGLARAHFLW